MDRKQEYLQVIDDTIQDLEKLKRQLENCPEYKASITYTIATVTNITDESVESEMSGINIGNLIKGLSQLDTLFMEMPVEVRKAILMYLMDIQMG